MEFIILLIFLIVLNFLVIKLSRGIRKRFIISSIIVILCSPIVFIITGVWFSVAEESGFGGAMYGILCSILTLINGIVYLIKGLLTKKTQ